MVFLPSFAEGYKAGLSLSGSHFIISSLLIFTVGLDLELVGHCVAICNSSSG